MRTPFFAPVPARRGAAHFSERVAKRAAELLAVSALCAGLNACGGGNDDNATPAPVAVAPVPEIGPSLPASRFAATSVVADSAGAAAHVDANLVNAWGVAFNPRGFVWVNNQGSNTSTLYDGNGVPQTLVVTIPAGTGGSAGPTGIVFNATQDFKVAANGVTAPAPFIFVGLGGTVSGWAPSVSPTRAITMVDTGAATPAAYTGLTMASNAGANYLYAADFRNGRVDVYDATWAKVTLGGGTFTDPNLPTGYAPFGIQAIGTRIYVTYAQRAATGTREQRGAGLGLVDVFDTSGALVKRLATGGKLNAPWGVALAPAGFGNLGNMLLVANTGDGTINAYDPASGAFAGTLSRADKSPIVVDGVHGIGFGNGLNSQPSTTLFYAAGPADGAHGAYGRIDSQ